MALNVGPVKAGARAAAHDRDRRQHAKNGYAASNPAQGLSPDCLHHRARRSRRGARSGTHGRPLTSQGAPEPTRGKSRWPPAARRRDARARRGAPRSQAARPQGLQGDADAAHPAEAADKAIHARHHHHHQSRGQQVAAGPLSLARHLLHAMRGRRLPPHHLFPRSARRARDLHVPHRGRREKRSDPARQRQSRGEGQAGRRQAFRGVARSAPEALLSLRPRRRRSRAHCFDLQNRVGRQRRSQDLYRARQGSPRRLGHGFAEALHALGRAPLRPRIRSRRVQHRRRVRLQHGRHGEQGPQHLQ